MFNQFQAELYQRLQNFELDDPTHEFGFIRHLMKNNGWTEHYAHRAIAEYKKFAFLTVVAEHQIVPSDATDQVWHAHLLLTQSYWSEFCPLILGKKLHHHPARGGKTERAEFHHLYIQTIASYRQYFGTPPQDIWSPPDVRFGKELKMQRFSKVDNWIIPKQLPRLKLNLIEFSLILSLFIFFTLFFANAVLASQAVDSSYDNLHQKIILISVIFSGLLYFVVRTPGKQEQKPLLDTYQVAYLGGGRNRAVELAIARLVHQGYLLPNIRNRTFAIAKRASKELNELELEIMQRVRQIPEFKPLIADLMPQTCFLKTSLRQQRLLVDEVWSIALVTIQIAIVFCCSIILGFGVFSFAIALLNYTYYRDLTVDLRTRWGDRVFRDIRRSHNSFDPIQRFALYGESALSGGALDDLKQIYKAQQEADTGGCGCGC